MEQEKIIKQMKEANDSQISKNELYGKTYRKMISIMAKDSVY